MKREIKFRAWDKSKRRMLDVEQLEFDLNGELVSIFCHGPIFSNDSENMIGEIPDLSRVVLMQYTGLHDKNGREIYEGDIIKNEHGQVMEVQYFPESAAFGVGDYYLRTIGAGTSLEVIGNIFEDKQLLEVTERDN